MKWINPEHMSIGDTCWILLA